MYKRQIPDRVYDRALFLYVQDSAVVEAQPSLPEQPIPVEITGSGDVTWRDEAGCIRLDPTGPDPRVRFLAPGGSILHLDMPAAGTTQVFLAQRAAPQKQASVLVESAAPDVATLVLPDLETTIPWDVRVDPPAVDSSTLCVTDA